VPSAPSEGLHLGDFLLQNSPRVQENEEVRKKAGVPVASRLLAGELTEPWLKPGLLD